MPAQEQIAAFANAVAETGQQVRLVVHDAANEARARQLVSRERGAASGMPTATSGCAIPGPLVVFDDDGQPLARRFGFNGWGGKYEMEGDQEIGGTMAERGRAAERHDGLDPRGRARSIPTAPGWW